MSHMSAADMSSPRSVSAGEVSLSQGTPGLPASNSTAAARLAASPRHAEWVKIPESLAKEVRDQFYPKENLRLDRLSGLDEAMADAVSMKFLAAPLAKQQQDELFKYYARGSK